MPKSTKLIAGWAVAATIAMVFSWGAVAQVRNRVIQPVVEIPTTVALANPLPDPTTTSASRVVTLEPELIESPTSITAVETPGTETTPGATPTTAPPNSTTPPPAVTSTTTTTEPPPTTSTTTTQPPSTTTTTAAPQTQTSSYTLQGGVVTISYSPGVVNFVSAIPQPGYSTDPRETGPDEVRIRFDSDNHSSEFRARWEDGELKVTQSESGES